MHRPISVKCDRDEFRNFGKQAEEKTAWKVRWKRSTEENRGYYCIPNQRNRYCHHQQNDQRTCMKMTELKETMWVTPTQKKKIAKGKLMIKSSSTTLTPFTQTYVQTLKKHSTSVPTTLLAFSVSWSDYAWLHISTETDTFRPPGITKCKQISSTLKLCDWTEISILRSFVL